MTADDIKRLLAVKHHEDLFVPECKNGPTVLTNHNRLDAWALKKSWTQPCSFGYEIKVSRGDWLRDEKIAAYLPLCHRLYIVCPAGLIAPDEMPTDVGLLWATATGTRLYTKRKAAHRDIAWPVDLMLYVLFSRVSVGAEYRGPSDVDRWRDWLATKAENRKLGYEVRRELRAYVEKVESERDTAVAHYEKVREKEEQLEALGLGWLGRWETPEKARERIVQKVAGVVGELSYSLESIARQIEQAKVAIDKAVGAEVEAAREQIEVGR